VSYHILRKIGPPSADGRPADVPCKQKPGPRGPGSDAAVEAS